MSDPEPLETINGTTVPRTGQLNVVTHRATVRISGTQLGQTLNSVSSVAPWVEQTSILALEEKFKALRPSQIHVYANDEQPIGPRIGVSDVAEPTLKALANFESERRARISERIWWLVGGLLLAAGSGYIGWLLK